VVYARTLNGTSANNTLNGDGRNEQINGLGGNDTLNGAGGSDRLDGGAGTDKLNGGAGDDILIGGQGNDTLTGGDGADVFVMAMGEGTDTVTDFEVGTDKIDATGYSSAQITIGQQGANTVISFSTGEVLILNGVQASSITLASFIGLTDGSNAKFATAKDPGHIDPLKPGWTLPDDGGGKAPTHVDPARPPHLGADLDAHLPFGPHHRLFDAHGPEPQPWASIGDVDWLI
jgi:hypothetical protein